MNFTYQAYGQMLQVLRERNYSICTYHNHADYDKCVILRHDVDMCLDKALRFAIFERDLDVVSTFFILLTSNHYNIASRKNLRIIKEIVGMGHEIGLHFDEARYGRAEILINAQELIEKERKIMSDILSINISVVSMHRPSKDALAADWRFENAVNSYSQTFFRNFKYLSDSRRRWREPVMDIITNATHDKLHILTHPFWYADEETTASEAIRAFIDSADFRCRDELEANIVDIGEFLQERGSEHEHS